MKKQIGISFAVTLAVICLLGFVKYLQISAAIAEGQHRTPPPEAITTFKAAQMTWPNTCSAIGTLSPVKGAMLGAEELGRVSRVNFQSGDFVKAGKVLVELDTSVETAELAGALSQLELATVNAKRQRVLREKNSNSASDLDSAEAAQRNANAQTQKLKAQIERKKITAPFDGRTGIRQVNEGQIVSAGTPIVSIQNSDELYLDFTVPQQIIRSIELGREVEFTVDTFTGETFKGRLTAIDPQINNQTRNLHLQATITNTENKLKPGMFVNATLQLLGNETVIAVPISSVNYAPYGDSVYVVESMKDPTGKEYLGVRSQIVKLGRKLGDMVTVVSDLKPGEEIAGSGRFKL